MNGSGEDWDGAYKLSSTGLGSEGTAKDTYLTVGDGGYTFEATVDWDTIDTIGIRATSTNTDGGSIKGVADCPDIYHAPVAADDVWALSDTVIPVGTITPEWFTHNDTDLNSATLNVTAINGQNTDGAIVGGGGLIADFDGGVLVGISGTAVTGDYNFNYTVSDGTNEDTANVSLKVVNTTGDGVDNITLVENDFSL